MITESKVMLSTIDNPFNPIKDFDNWRRYDEEKGYNCCSYLARVAQLTEDMSQKEEDLEIERAVEEIIELNPLGIYIKVKEDVPFIE